MRKGDDGRRSSASTSAFFSSDESASGGRSGPDPQALRAFEKLGGFAAMCRQLEPHATCQAMCDALMGMIFGVWGSKHEPRPIREKDVLAIKGNKESWLRCVQCCFFNCEPVWATAVFTALCSRIKLLCSASATFLCFCGIVTPCCCATCLQYCCRLEDTINDACPAYYLL